jgi:hypothetical protein
MAGVGMNTQTLKPSERKINLGILQHRLYVPASALKTMGCKVDIKYLPSGILLDCSGVRSRDVVFVKIW